MAEYRNPGNKDIGRDGFLRLPEGGGGMGIKGPMRSPGKPIKSQPYNSTWWSKGAPGTNKAKARSSTEIKQTRDAKRRTAYNENVKKDNAKYGKAKQYYDPFYGFLPIKNGGGGY